MTEAFGFLEKGIRQLMVFLATCWSSGMAIGLGAGLSALVVMCMTPPRSAREWVVGITCTVVGSIAGGAFVIEHFQLQSWAASGTGLMAMLGLVFACGLPAWAVVRWTFAYIQDNRDASLVDIAGELREKILPRKD